jgi:succinoglycan biosynthesis transport protein ExoP
VSRKTNQQAQGKTSKRADRAPEVRANADTIAPERASDGADLNDLLDLLLRQKRLIISIVVTCLVVAIVALSLATPRYTATAELIIDVRRPALPGLEAVLPSLAIDNQSIISETAVLQSRGLLGSVVKRLDLKADPEFNGALRPPGLRKRIEAWVGLGDESRPEEGASSAVVDALASKVRVAQIPDSRVISVRVTSESPEKACEITNTLVDEYLASQQKAKTLATSQTNSWLDERINELRNDLLASEKRVEDFRSKADLLQAEGSTLISQQMADLNAQLTAAKTARAGAEAQLSQLEELMQSSSDNEGIFTASEVLQSPLIQNLRQQQVAAERELAEASSELGPQHPRIIQLKANAEDVSNQISIEVNKIAQGLRNDVSVAKAREKALQERVAELTSKLSQTNQDQIQLRALEREADSDRQLLETLLSRQKEFGSPAQSQPYQADARVISDADQPTSPSYPQKGFSLGITLVLSTLLALIVAFIREVRRRGFLNTDQLEAATKLSALGYIPLISSRRQKRNILDRMVTNPATPFAQALKTVNWQLTELAPNPCKVVLITSAVPGEGKTTTAIGLARTRALEGRKTLLIDADIRNPNVHKHLNKPQGPGLRDVLESRLPVDEAIVYDEISSLDVITAGEASGDPLNWIDSPRMKEIRAALTKKYQYIIIDSPPIAVAPDACPLSKLADTTVLLVRWSDTPGDMVKYALRILRRNGGHVTGSVLTMLDVARSKYVYGYYGTYGPYAEQTS